MSNIEKLVRHDEIRILLPKGEKEKIAVHAERRGESLNDFITRAIAETIWKDKHGSYIFDDRPKDDGGYCD